MDEKTRQELLELLKQCSPRQRSTTIQAIEGRVSDDKVGYIKEQLAFVEDDLTPRDVTFYSMHVCNCGELLSQQTPCRGSVNTRDVPDIYMCTMLDKDIPENCAKNILSVLYKDDESAEGEAVGFLDSLSNAESNDKKQNRT